MKIWLLSDTHCEHEGLAVPEVDAVEWLEDFWIALHAGFFYWAYMKARSELDIVWQSIPDDIDILITHGPPKGIMDVTADLYTGEPVHVGSKSLMRHVAERIRPRIHAFGHIHDEPGISNFGTVTHGVTQFINCACCSLTGELANHGMIIEISRPENVPD